MTYRDDEQHPVPNPAQAMVGARSHDALVPQHSNGVPAPAIYPISPPPPRQDVLRGGMDANSFLNCLRRRWLLALSMGTVSAVILATIVYMLLPETSSATALFNVASHKPALLESDNGQAIKEFEILQRTQLAYLKSPYVIQAAIRDPAIASLSALAGETDPVQYLIQSMNSTFAQNSEILSLSLSSDGDPEDLRRLVDAVSKAYLEEVVHGEELRSGVVHDALAKSFARLSDEISTKMNQYNDLAKELGISSEEGKRDPESEILLREINDLMKSKADAEARLAVMQTDYMIAEQRAKDPRLIEAIVDEKLAGDPTMAQMNQEMSMLQYQISQQSSARNGKSRESDRLQRDLQAKQQQMAQYRQAMMSQLKGDSKDGPQKDLQAYRKEFQIRAGVASQQLAGINKAIAEKTEKLMQKGEQSVDLNIKKAELSQLQEIARDMSIKLERLDVEAIAPQRIRQIQPATLQPDINWMTRWALTGASGLFAFGLTCVGIAFLEFRNRRLDGAHQMGEGLGIRVVGTLPSLAGRMLDPDHPIVAQLTESIDSVRTQLMHDSTSKRRQVVLVTSAAAMEGRTTVASQLAASLARAGRRTLLIDGDVRRPALHALFDVPLEDGLCEVLRAEVDVADVVRPTHAEGLWLLTAGYCDIDAIHALATEQMQPVFEKLRGEYDFIIIDGAPVIGMPDALIFGQYSDGVILSVRRDFSQMPKINEAAAMLQSVGVRMIGAVVNGVPTKSDDRVTQLRLIAPKSERELQSA